MGLRLCVVALWGDLTRGTGVRSASVGVDAIVARFAGSWCRGVPLSMLIARPGWCMQLVGCRAGVGYGLSHGPDDYYRIEGGALFNGLGWTGERYLGEGWCILQDRMGSCRRNTGAGDYA